MPYRHLLIILCLPFQLLIAQDSYHSDLLTQLAQDFDVTGGSWVLDDSEAENNTNLIIYGNVNTNERATTENSFSTYHAIDVLSQGADPWESGLNIRSKSTINKNDVVLASFWARGSAGAEVNFFAENGTTFAKELFFKVVLEESWKQYFVSFESTDQYAPGALVVGMHLAFGVQHVDFAGIALLNYNTKYTTDELPNTFKDQLYEGAEADAAWRAPAQARIEEYRKSKVRLQITDTEQNPLAGSTISVRMKKHDFEFGSAVVSSRFADNSNHSAIYQEKMLNLDGQGHGFNTIVFENSLKWRAWEGNWPATQTEKRNAINWLQERDITIRGHNLLWPGWNFLPADMEVNKENPDFLKNRILEHFETILDIPEVRDYIRDWDVINEITEVRDLEAALKNKLGYTTGREIYAELFKKVKEINPDIICYLNDYITISRDADSGQKYDEFKQFTQEILDAGGPIDGLGFQAHIPASMPGPQKVYNILEDFYSTFGLETKVTEYDLDSFVSDEVAARYMADFLTIIYSHPSMKGFLTWGFWDGAHWKDNAPFFNLDWSLKPSGQAFIDKVFGEWWTDIDVVADSDGFIEFEGYNGYYEVVSDVNDAPAPFFFNKDTTGVVALEIVTNTLEVEFDNAFNLYPNPAMDFVELKSNGKQSFDLKVYNSSGRVVHTLRGRDYCKFNLDNYSPGLYLFRITQDQKSYIKKLVKQ